MRTVDRSADDDAMTDGEQGGANAPPSEGLAMASTAGAAWKGADECQRGDEMYSGRDPEPAPEEPTMPGKRPADKLIDRLKTTQDHKQQVESVWQGIASRGVTILPFQTTGGHEILLTHHGQDVHVQLTGSPSTYWTKKLYTFESRSKKEAIFLAKEQILDSCDALRIAGTPLTMYIQHGVAHRSQSRPRFIWQEVEDDAEEQENPFD